ACLSRPGAGACPALLGRGHDRGLPRHLPTTQGRTRREAPATRRPTTRIVMFYHSLLSDWNHGNAHFLRGIVSELQSRGHSVAVHEPADGWSLQNLRRDHDERAIADFRRAYPGLESRFYDPATLDLDQALEGAELVLVH